MSLCHSLVIQGMHYEGDITTWLKEKRNSAKVKTNKLQKIITIPENSLNGYNRKTYICSEFKFLNEDKIFIKIKDKIT